MNFSIVRCIRQTPHSLLIFLLTALLFTPSLQSGFMYDSEPQILHCDFLHNPAHVSDILTLRVVRMDLIDRARPVQLLSLMADALLWGREPFGYQLTSLLLHALNASMLFLLLMRVLDSTRPFRRPAAWIGALLFSAHPALAEAVTEVSFREDLLATGGILAGLLAYSSAARHTGWRRIATAGAAVMFLLMAAGAKETGWTGPFFIAASTPLLVRKKDHRLAGTIFLVSAVLISAFAFYSRYAAPVESAIFVFSPTYPDSSLPGMLQLLPRLWIFQLQQLFFPFNLSADYGPFSIRHLPATAAIPAVFILAAGTLLAAKRMKPLRFGLLVFVCAMVPTSNLLPLFKPLADRYLYLPMTGISIILATSLTLLPSRPRHALALVLFSLLFVWVPLSIQRQRVWTDPVRLWSDTLDKNPYSIAASNNLGYAYLSRKQYQEALHAWSRTIQIAPEYANAWAGAAIALDSLDQPAKAEAAFRRAVEIDPLYKDPAALRLSMRMSPAEIDRLSFIAQRMGHPE